MLNVDFSFGDVLIFREQTLDVVCDRRVWGKENGDSQFSLQRVEHAFRFVREGVFLVARKIPSPIMLEAEIIHHQCQEDEQANLNDDVEPDLETMNFLWFLRHGYSLHLRD